MLLYAVKPVQLFRAVSQGVNNISYFFSFFSFSFIFVDKLCGTPITNVRVHTPGKLNAPPHGLLCSEPKIINNKSIMWQYY